MAFNPPSSASVVLDEEAEERVSKG